MDTEMPPYMGIKPPMTNSGKVVAVVLVVFLAAGFAAIITAFLVDVPRFYSLTQHGQLTTGTVISKERENHMSISFEYNVDGHKYKSVGGAERIGKSFETILIGEQVPVYYDQSDPASAVMGEPQKHLYGSLTGVGFIFFGLILSFIVYVIKRGVF